MKTKNTELSAYLDEVARLLDAPERDRGRLLEEIEAHLCDAIEHRVDGGMDATTATRLAIEEFGPPSAVSIQQDSNGHVRRGLTHWLPIALPVLLTALAAIGAVYSASRLPNGTIGDRAALRIYLESLVVFGGIAAAGWLWLRHRHRPATVSPAWLATVAALAVLVF